MQRVINKIAEVCSQANGLSGTTVARQLVKVIMTGLVGSISFALEFRLQPAKGGTPTQPRGRQLTPALDRIFTDRYIPANGKETAARWGSRISREWDFFRAT